MPETHEHRAQESAEDPRRQPHPDRGGQGHEGRHRQGRRRLPRAIPAATFMPQQFENPANPAIHEATTGPEIWNDTDGKMDILVSGVGTGRDDHRGEPLFQADERARRSSPSRWSRRNRPSSPRRATGEELKPGSHKIQGIGAGFVPKVLAARPGGPHRDGHERRSHRHGPPPRPGGGHTLRHFERGSGHRRRAHRERAGEQGEDDSRHAASTQASATCRAVLFQNLFPGSGDGNSLGQSYLRQDVKGRTPMKISTKGRYGLRAMMDLAANQRDEGRYFSPISRGDRTYRRSIWSRYSPPCGPPGW